MAADEELSISASTLAIHADDAMNRTTDVAPAIHVSTTYRYTSDVDQLVPLNDEDVRGHFHLAIRSPGIPLRWKKHG
jgi:hypothetical protein